MSEGYAYLKSEHIKLTKIKDMPLGGIFLCPKLNMIGLKVDDENILIFGEDFPYQSGANNPNGYSVLEVQECRYEFDVTNFPELGTLKNIKEKPPEPGDIVYTSAGYFICSATSSSKIYISITGTGMAEKFSHEDGVIINRWRLMAGDEQNEKCVYTHGCKSGD